MLRHRRLIPLLAAVLVIQSLVAVLPHTHGSAANGQVWQASSHIGATHHCLACSVQAPVVEPIAEVGGAACLATTILVSIDCKTSNVLSIDSTASPRGPPWIV